MESASTLPSLPSFENLRPGQRDVVDRFRSGTSVVAQLPTGYGKTRTAACSFLMLRARGVVNRILYVVPRSAQACQAAEDVPRDLLSCGELRTKGCEIGYSPIEALRAHRRGDTEVFVVTVQSLVSSPRAIDAVAELMSTGRWMLVIDEHHHYGAAEDSAWTSRIKSLPSNAMLAMSATPDRPDGPSVFGKPDVKVSYVQAYRDHAVKPLDLHAYEYRVDAITINGEVISMTTGELIDEAGGTDPELIEKFIASRQMKWSPKYISPLVLHPIERLGDLQASGVKSQMLVQALSCSHAKMVCEQIRSIAPDGVVVDWAGTGPNGRSDDDNRAALQSFCPPKNDKGVRAWKTQILVNVGMAGEGLDCTDVSEVVFLTSPRKNNTSLQVIGRGARVMRHSQAIRCTVNVDSGSELAGMVGALIMGIFDGEAPTPQEVEEIDNERADRDYQPLPDEPGVGIVDVTLIDIRKDSLFKHSMNDYTENPERYPGLTREVAEREFTRLVREHNAQRDARFNQTSTLEQIREQCNAAVRKLSGLIVRAESNDGRIEKSRIGDVMKLINGMAVRSFGPVKTADEETLRRRWAWLKQLEASALANERPPWL